MKAKITVLSPNGFAVEFETPEVKDRHILLNTWAEFEAELLEAGYTPVKGQPAPASPPAANGGGSFIVDRITATVDSEKDTVYWRVKGGEFQKFGVIVYPEVLEAAGLGNLNPLEQFSEPGMVAVYSTKEDGVKPKKVIRLERAGK